MSELAVTLTVEQLGALVEARVEKALAALPTVAPPEVLDPRACAELLGISTKTVSQLVKHDALPVHYLSEREPRFLRREVLAWVAGRAAQPPRSPEVAA